MPIAIIGANIATTPEFSVGFKYIKVNVNKLSIADITSMMPFLPNLSVSELKKMMETQSTAGMSEL